MKSPNVFLLALFACNFSSSKVSGTISFGPAGRTVLAFRLAGGPSQEKDKTVTSQ